MIVPRVSVIVPVYNAGPYLQDCLWSITLQWYSNIEVIIIDDCSTDGSVDMIQRWVDLTKKHGQQDVIFIKHSENVGECKTCEEGFRIATGEYLIRLSCDDKYLDRQQLAKQVLAMKRRNLEWSYASRILITNEYDTHAERHVITVSMVPFPNQMISGIFSIFDNILLKHKYYSYFVNIIRNPINVNSLMIRADTHRRVTSWDHGYRTACDAFVTGDLILSGARGGVVRDTIAFWRIHKNQQTQQKTTQDLYSRMHSIKYDVIRNGNHPWYIKIAFELLRRVFG